MPENTRSPNPMRERHGGFEGGEGWAVGSQGADIGTPDSPPTRMGVMPGWAGGLGPQERPLECAPGTLKKASRRASAV